MATVLGGGLSGLSAAYYLMRRFGQPVTVYEASTRLGGWVRTEQHKEGFVFEAGPRTIRPKGAAGANTLELIEELQMPLDAIPSTHAAARNRLIYAKGQLCPLPNSLGGVFKTLPPFSQPLFRVLLNDLRAERKTLKHGDESIYDFVMRRFGAELAQYAISPMICGICAGDAKEISVRFLMNDLFETEQKWGGVVKGLFLDKLVSTMGRRQKAEGIFSQPMPTLFTQAQREKWSMYRTQSGLEALPRTLGAYLRDRNNDIHLSAECREMRFTGEDVRMTIKDRDVHAPHVVSALPAHKLAACVKDQHPSLSAQLLLIPYVDVAVVNLQYSADDLLQMNAFGLLVPPVEQLPILGVIFDSCCFDMGGSTVLTVMMGGRWFEANFGKSPSKKELLDTALQQLERILGIVSKPKLARVHVLHKCIPQYTVGHKQRVADIRRYISQYKLPLTLCGAAYEGVGINDVILSARKQVYALPENYPQTWQQQESV